MLRIAIFLLSLTVQFGLHYYLWRRLIRDTKLHAPWDKWCTWTLVVLGISIPLVIASNKVTLAVGRTIGWPVFFWMGLAALLTTWLLIFDSGRTAHWLLQRVQPSPKSLSQTPAPENPSRRAFMHRIAGGGAVMTSMSLSAKGAYQALRTPPVVDIHIALKRFPAKMNGFSIVQITDLHVGNTIGEAFVRSVVHAANAAKPDVIVITGDLIDGTVDNLRPHVAPLGDLRAPHGVFFVTGNHEYYSGVDAWLAHIRELGIRVLRNERVRIGVGDDSFDLAGIDDYNAARWPGHGADLALATRGRDVSKELILLAHQPRQVHQSATFGVGLQISGHTHGGQIWPWHYAAKIQQGGLLAGHSWHNNTQLYISRGTGYWGPPIRVFAKSEITKIILNHQATG